MCCCISPEDLSHEEGRGSIELVDFCRTWMMMMMMAVLRAPAGAEQGLDDSFVYIQ